MMKQNKFKLIVSSVVILLPVLAGLLMWDMLPDSMATHWGANGEADGFSSKAFAIFVPPLIILAGHWFCMMFTLKDPKNKDQSSKMFDMLMWIMPVVSLVTSGMMYMIALGYTTGVDVWVRVLLGVMFLVMGNYLPKCKQNHTVGVKVPWTLQSEENWYKTHRFTGRLWVVSGLIILATIYVPMENIMWVFVALVMIAGFLPMLYSYLYYRKQLKENTWSKTETATAPKQKTATIIAVAISVPVLIFVGVILFTGEFTVQFEEDAFQIQADFWKDITVDYDKIDSVEYREQDVPGVRTYGFGSLKLMMGNFENEEFGGYIRYSYTDCKACVVLRSKEQVLVINGENEDATREIYEQLRTRVE